MFVLLRALHANVSERGYVTATALEAKVTNFALKLTPLSRNWHASCSKDSGVELSGIV
jgi:hypothetical protein